MPPFHIMTIYLAGLGVVSLAATALWLASVRLTNASIADVGWGPGFALAALTYAALGMGWPPRATLVLAMVGVWGIRLALHVATRNRGKGEDYRYREFRLQYGPHRFWWVSLFQTFYLQALLLWIVSAPVFAAVTAAQPAGFVLLDGLGIVMWGAGFAFESIGDAQLARFKADPANRGRVLQAGLWRYTRHPNYFGYAVAWWGLYLVALGAGGWWSAFGPFLMTLLLVRVSGSALRERSLLNPKPGYVEYVRRTSSFIPLPPKRIE